MTQGVGNWTFNVLPDQAGRRSEKQSPWYDMATAAVAMIARPYIPQGGKVYDLGCAAGNVGRVLAPTLHEREAQFVALDGCRDVVVAYCGPGRAIMADVASYPYKPFDVAVAFLTLMDLPSSTRQLLLSTLREKVKPGGAIIVVDKEESPGGYPATVLSRLTFGCKVEREAHEARKWRGHYTLEIYSALYRSELGPDAVEAFRLGDFVGWLIEG
ncbi:methyltransferase type 12 [Bilophila wadsworthia]|uniref:methyltransferase type 12 n=1 Tax=Bilophila wadsworthia TaxID=35833 RepID=UPI0028E805B4|nr:methyltransferase type 12 [Bilophila wadsworthia]